MSQAKCLRSVQRNTSLHFVLCGKASSLTLWKLAHRQSKTVIKARGRFQSGAASDAGAKRAARRPPASLFSLCSDAVKSGSAPDRQCPQDQSLQV